MAENGAAGMLAELEERLRVLFVAFFQRFQKQEYLNDRYQFGNFYSTVLFMEKQSKRLVETVEALNAMAACSESEFRSRRNLAPEWLILKPETNMRDIVVGAWVGGVYMPPYKREVSQPSMKPFLPPVVNQGEYPNCWAAASCSLAYMLAARYNTLLDDATNPDFHSPLAPLSVQDLVNRRAKLTGGVKHVKGYFNDRALVSVRKEGVVLEAVLPFVGPAQVYSNTLQRYKVPIMGTPIYTARPSDDQVHYEFQCHGALIATVAYPPAQAKVWRVYKESYSQRLTLDLTGCHHETWVFHNLILYNIGADEEGRFYEVFNSWGPDWAEQGCAKVVVNGGMRVTFLGITAAPKFGNPITPPALSTTELPSASASISCCSPCYVS